MAAHWSDFVVFDHSNPRPAHASGQERILALERYSKEYNLRFYNVPETPGENCIDKLQTILHKDLNI